MGAYFRFFPKAHVETLIPPFFFGPTFVLPAVVFLGWWFLLQFLSGTASLASPGKAFGGIAWWAHIGGFAFGLIVCLLVRNKQRLRPRFIEI
jgi:membrane associated rhomboid family serine protease